MYKMNSFDIPDGYLPDGIQISCNEGIETGEIFVRARYSFVSHGIVKFSGEELRKLDDGQAVDLMLRKAIEASKIAMQYARENAGKET